VGHGEHRDVKPDELLALVNAGHGELPEDGRYCVTVAAPRSAISAEHRLDLFVSRQVSSSRALFNDSPLLIGDVIRMPPGLAIVIFHSQSAESSARALMALSPGTYCTPRRCPPGSRLRASAGDPPSCRG